MPAFSVHVVLLCLLTVVRGSDTECVPRPITCDAGTFALGERAKVSCNLYASMIACKLDVTVVRYSPDDPRNDPGIDIVSCQWDETKKNHRCRVDSGYEFDCENGENPKLEIPTVQNDSAGFYMCYVMSVEAPTSHVCKLSTRDRLHVRSTTALSPTRPPVVSQDTSRKQMHGIAVLGTITGIMAVVISVLVAFVLRYKHRLKSRSNTDPDPEASKHILLDDTEEIRFSTDQLTRPPLDENIETELHNFRLDKKDLERIVYLIIRQLKESSRKSSTTCFKYLPIKEGAYSCLVAVLSDASLKVMLIKLRNRQIDVQACTNYTALQATDTGEHTWPKLVDFVRKCVTDFVHTQELSGAFLQLAVVFSCPCEYTMDTDQGMDTVRLTKPIKGFECDDVIGQSLKEVIQQNLRQNNGGRFLEIKVVVDDAVDVLRAAFHQDPNSKVAVVHGNRFNASFLKERDAQKLMITTDCGSLGDGGRLDLYMTEFDRRLDEQSANKGAQILDKMVSGAYMGELVRVVLVELKQKRLLFKSSSGDCSLCKGGAFTTDFIHLIESDTDGNYHNTQFVLKQLGVDSFTIEDCGIVRHVCMVVSERAAHLAAAGLAAVIKHMEQKEVTVALNSSPYVPNPHFYQPLKDKAKELLGDSYKLEFRSCSKETGKGAALIAAAT